MARFARQTERSGGQKGRGLGGRNFCPLSLSAAAEFRISLCEMRRQELCLIIFILFGSIIIRAITLYTTILPKLYLYDKWKNNQRKYQESAHQTWLDPRRFSQESGHQIYNAYEGRKRYGE
ncbi:MAG: hypothetical protein UX68_C0018G0002 [Parcubacteria group bacterium GW2011_GWA2_46_9]|nr:MAG: hypothetical protein UX68_C0018G0002 [Parcubacteria group bacterium GW2011_GWA2_46_9]